MILVEFSCLTQTARFSARYVVMISTSLNVGALIMCVKFRRRSLGG